MLGRSFFLIFYSVYTRSGHSGCCMLRRGHSFIKRYRRGRPYTCLILFIYIISDAAAKVSHRGVLFQNGQENRKRQIVMQLLSLQKPNRCYLNNHGCLFQLILYSKIHLCGTLIRSQVVFNSSQQSVDFSVIIITFYPLGDASRPICLEK